MIEELAFPKPKKKVKKKKSLQSTGVPRKLPTKLPRKEHLSLRYLEWIRSLPCCCCETAYFISMLGEEIIFDGRRRSDPSHLIAIGAGGDRTCPRGNILWHCQNAGSAIQNLSQRRYLLTLKTNIR